jgi:cyclopropane fatty-acyl-phospholipid synthase-like methyltransferase
MTLYLVISLIKIPYIHRIYRVLANPSHAVCLRAGAGTFDRVVSIEMIEAVGHEHLGSYFATIGRMLKPGGRAVVQAITYPDERWVCSSVHVQEKLVFFL